jgi:acetoin utilization deacetylase AcuC-like enzyme
MRGVRYPSMARPLLLRHPSSLRHDTGSHPERAARITAIEQELEAHDWLGWEIRESAPAARASVEAVHPSRYVLAIEEFCAAGGGNLDLDTVVSTDSFEAAMHAAGGACAAVDAVLEGHAPVTFTMHRPPGHHAEAARAMGFCLFNNVAIAARRALDAHGLSRVLVLDWDVHHGNGTNDIFHADPQVLFVSIHQWPLYPGTGAASDEGSGAGEGYTVNLPVPGGSGDALWCSLVEHVVAPLAGAFAPELVLLSAGYDAHADDPLAGCEVSDDGFAAMAGSVRRFAESAGAPVAMILEGGYDLGALSRGVSRTLAVLGASDAPATLDLPVHPAAAEAATRLAARWPALSSSAA